MFLIRNATPSFLTQRGDATERLSFQKTGGTQEKTHTLSHIPFQGPFFDFGGGGDQQQGRGGLGGRHVLAPRGSPCEARLGIGGIGGLDGRLGIATAAVPCGSLFFVGAANSWS